MQRNEKFIITDTRRNNHMKKIGFIGVGIMGKSMVRNLMKAGFELHIYNCSFWNKSIHQLSL